MTVTLYGIANCDTVKKARRWLDDAGVAYRFHDFRKQGLDAARLAGWIDRLGWEAVLNRAGSTFRKLPEPDRQAIDRERAVGLMLAQPSMVKRPVTESEGEVMVGFSPERYAAAFPVGARLG